MTTDDRVQFLGEREHQMKIGNRQKFLTAFFKPALRVVPLALRATAVFARVVGVLPMPAAITVLDMTTEHLRATVTDVVERATVTRQHRLAKTFEVRIAVAAQNVCNFQQD